jgi:hypothetical protein
VTPLGPRDGHELKIERGWTADANAADGVDSIAGHADRESWEATDEELSVLSMLLLRLQAPLRSEGRSWLAKDDKSDDDGGDSLVVSFPRSQPALESPKRWRYRLRIRADSSSCCCCFCC